ncbi:hemolysin expression modulator Hha [Pantoea agglomerans]|uniref:hemolysin expression modulator Hha n=1 Tax=Enterobacter agglomerans TaxID=549 RepID=UPI0013CC896D|nr:hemolysin expression modulator Hha [Pantoea agglomerans]NEG64486.1 hemolysin expression modulator Hha [Pantoea agglomerans]
MTKQDWLYRLRRCRTLETLEKIIESSRYRLNNIDLVNFYGASDHRLAELTMKRLYDRVPASVWRLIR